MKLGVIGVGQAGGRIADQFYSHDVGTGIDCVADAMAVNISRPDLSALRTLPQERRVLVGQDEKEGHGVGSDQKEAAHLVHDDIRDILYRLEEMPLAEIEAFAIIAGTGGGVGGGGGPVIAKYLEQRYDIPIITIAVLPFNTDSHLHKINSIRAIRGFEKYTENIILFDNDVWTEESGTVETNYLRMNDEFVIRLSAVFGATEPASSGEIGTSVVDGQALMKTFEDGTFSIIGYEEKEVEREELGFFSRLLGREGDMINIDENIEAVIKEASVGRMSASGNIENTNSVLAIAAGPNEHLSQSGLNNAYTWIEERTKSKNIRTGDYPIVEEEDVEVDYIAGIVVFSGIPSAEKIVELYSDVVGINPSDSEDDVMTAFIESDNAPDSLV